MKLNQMTDVLLAPPVFFIDPQIVFQGYVTILSPASRKEGNFFLKRFTPCSIALFTPREHLAHSHAHLADGVPCWGTFLRASTHNPLNKTGAEFPRYYIPVILFADFSYDHCIG